MTEHPIDLEEMISCVQREVNYRRHVYGRATSERRMNKHYADRQIAVMQAILDKLRTERGDGPLLEPRGGTDGRGA